MIPIFHGIYNAMVKPYLAGKGLSPDSQGVVKFRRFDETMIYRTK